MLGDDVAATTSIAGVAGRRSSIVTRSRVFTASWQIYVCSASFVVSYWPNLSGSPMR